ncbi:EF-hand calcium-binding domain-containing protein 5 [Amblyraja radiata]|uniref:EF-hand calcium-binding domain-containing protein 5 n=1 Tax=Amblyraja radiata TaxID=386614 RepID=UPI001404176A|nr:EF-hand calcium-binding domain-containing protein 5 [Amblyraja radiata]
MDKEEDQMKLASEPKRQSITIISEGEADDGSKLSVHAMFGRSASLAPSSTDNDSLSSLRLGSGRSTSLVPGIIDHVEDSQGAGASDSAISQLVADGVSSKLQLESRDSDSSALGVSENESFQGIDNRLQFPLLSKRSASLATSFIRRPGADGPSDTLLGTKRSTSLVPGIIDRLNVDNTVGNLLVPSASSIGHARAADATKFHKSWTDFGAREAQSRESKFNKEGQSSLYKPTADEAEQDPKDGRNLRQSAKRPFPSGSPAGSAEDRHKIGERKISISTTGPNVQSVVSIGRKGSIDTSGHSYVHRIVKPPRARSSFSVHDPSEPLKSKLEVKRASFQTSLIEGFVVRDMNLDEQEDGAKNLWKRMFGRKVARRVLFLQEQRTLFMQKHKREKANLEKKIPMDLLTKEWFDENKTTVQTRIYLLEKLLPTLILGLENLLTEVEKKSLNVLDKAHPYFNPINFLAQFLMRHNPKYYNLPEDDAYIIGLQYVTQELKNYVADIKDNRQDFLFPIYTLLFYLKLETKHRDKEKQDKINAAIRERRREKLRVHYRDWKQSTNGIVLLSLAQSVLVSFSEAFADYLFETFEVKYMYSYIKGLSDSPFADFLVYLSHSSDFFYHNGQQDWWRQRFAELFLECDVGKCGLLNRQMILLLFEEFYDQQSDASKLELHNPRKWPLIELDEMEPEDFMVDFGNEYISGQVPALYYTAPESGQDEEEAADGTPRDQQQARESNVAVRPITAQTFRTSIGDIPIGIPSHNYIREEEEARLSKFPDLTTIILDLQSHSLALHTSPFKRRFKNIVQFVQLMEVYVGKSTSTSTKENLIEFIQATYKETKEEKLENIAQANQVALQNTHKIILDALFEKWDNDVSGHIKLRELTELISKYKDGTERNSLKRAHHKLKLYRKYYSDNPALTKSEFNVYIETLVAEISGKEDDFENLVTFLTARSEQNCLERARHRARRKWFYDIKWAAVTSSSSMEPVYKVVFQSLYKDTEAHGDNKRISSSIALLRHNYHRPDRGEVFLHYVACTVEDAPYVLNQALYRDMGVSFAVVDEGRPLHIYRVQDHSKVHFWNCHRERTEGSFLAIPIKDHHNRVFGVMGIDTLRDKCGKVFTAHEINFYQGIAKAFSIAYHHVRLQSSILRAVDSAMMWLFNISPSIQTGITYLVEPTTTKEYVLCKTMTSENDPIEQWSDVHSPPMILNRKDNYFRNYLFRCADTSEVVFSSTYKGKRVCVPLRGRDGITMAILDIDLGTEHEIVAHEYRSMLKMLDILNKTCSIIVQGSTDPEGSLDIEFDNEYEGREKVLFHELMLKELIENIRKLNEQDVAEVMASIDPPLMVHKVFKIVFHLMKPNITVEGLTWNQLKEQLNYDLIQQICDFNPITTISKMTTYLLQQYFKDVRPDEVWNYGCHIVYYLYNWSYLCFTLMEVKSNLRHFYRPPSVCHLASSLEKGSEDTLSGRKPILSERFQNPAAAFNI